MRLPSILPFGFLLTRWANIHLELPHRPGAPAGGMWKGAGGSLGCRFGDLGTHLFLPDSVVTGSSAHRLLAERSVCGIKDPCYCHHQTIREQSATYGVPFGDGTCGCWVGRPQTWTCRLSFQQLYLTRSSSHTAVKHRMCKAFILTQRFISAIV